MGGIHNQVTVSCVHLTSYDFLQTPPLASDALAIQIILTQTGRLRLFQANGFAQQKKRSLTAPNACQLRPETYFFGFF